MLGGDTLPMYLLGLNTDSSDSNIKITEFWIKYVNLYHDLVRWQI